MNRADLYNRAHPKWPPLVTSGGWTYGVWMIGNNYRNPSKLYGAYPQGYMGRVMSMFPDAESILHVFSGSMSLGSYTRVDSMPERRPDVVADAINLPFQDGLFDLVLADPPYSPADAEKYGTRMPVSRLVLRELARVTVPAGNLVWLDTKLPMYRRIDWTPWGTIGLIRSTNHRVRLVSMFRKGE